MVILLSYQERPEVNERMSEWVNEWMNETLLADNSILLTGLWSVFMFPPQPLGAAESQCVHAGGVLIMTN